MAHGWVGCMGVAWGCSHIWPTSLQASISWLCTALHGSLPMHCSCSALAPACGACMLEHNTQLLDCWSTPHWCPAVLKHINPCQAFSCLARHPCACEPGVWKCGQEVRNGSGGAAYAGPGGGGACRCNCQACPSPAPKHCSPPIVLCTAAAS